MLSNITACGAVVDAIRTTLGPRGMDKLIVDSKGNFDFFIMLYVLCIIYYHPSYVFFSSLKGVATISNDGATIMKLLEIVHPAARALVDVARAQDAEVKSNFYYNTH